MFSLGSLIGSDASLGSPAHAPSSGSAHAIAHFGQPRARRILFISTRVPDQSSLQVSYPGGRACTNAAVTGIAPGPPRDDQASRYALRGLSLFCLTPQFYDRQFCNKLWPFREREQ